MDPTLLNDLTCETCVCAVCTLQGTSLFYLCTSFWFNGSTLNMGYMLHLTLCTLYRYRYTTTLWEDSQARDVVAFPGGLLLSANNDRTWFIIESIYQSVSLSSPYTPLSQNPGLAIHPSFQTTSSLLLNWIYLEWVRKARFPIHLSQSTSSLHFTCHSHTERDATRNIYIYIRFRPKSTKIK